MKTLSVIIPVYNEIKTVAEIIRRVQQVVLVGGFAKEIIIVDDGSSDGTRAVLETLPGIKLVCRERNAGKGAAIRTGIKHCTGDYIIIQDADLEYDPQDFNILLQAALDKGAPVVYGSRELRHQPHRYSHLSFYLGGLLLTKLTNWLYGQRLTDEPTCYKLFQASVLKSLPLRCRRFEFCPEVTARIARQGIKIPEVAISYQPRGKESGKKINWRDGLEAIWTLLRYRLTISRR
jgi:glycosyltransferase involved in cell wall biosynthesis